MRYIVAVFLLTLSVAACAKPQTLSWNWPTQDCDSVALDQAQWINAEIIYDTEPMPMPSDTAGPCSATPDPDGPATATSVPITASQPTQVTLNLQPGITYFARIRVCYTVATNCSAWSAETQFTVPYGKPNRPIWLN
jgi:hypothetical protein